MTAVAALAGPVAADSPARSRETAARVGRVGTVPGMPPVTNSRNLYSETRAGKLSAAVRGALPRVYVPNRQANTVSVIDPTSMTLVETFAVGLNPQHIVPSYDLETLWVTNNAEGQTTAA